MDVRDASAFLVWGAAHSLPRSQWGSLFFVPRFPGVNRSATLLLLLLFVAGLAPSSRAQSGQTTALFLKIHPQPRIHALGKATVALDGYSGAIDVNPATIGEPGVARFGTNMGAGASPLYASDWLPDARGLGELWVSNGGGSVRRDSWAVGAHWKYLSLGSIEVRDADGRSLGTYDLAEWETTVAGAYDVTRGLTLGMGAKVIRIERLGRSENPEPEGTTSTAIDLGVQYDRSYPLGSAKLRPLLGWSLTNFGPNIELDDSDPGDQALPLTMRAGAGGELATARQWQNRSVLQLGVYGALSKRLSHSRIVCDSGAGDSTCYADADGPLRALFSTGWKARELPFGTGDDARLSAWEQTIKHVGVEVQFAEILSFQWGRFKEHEHNGNRQYTSFGFGLDLHFVILEHAWTDGEGRLDNSFWRLTGRIPLDGPIPSNFWPDVTD